MTAYFLDSSALVKRYAAETGSAWVESLTDPRAGNRIYVAAITHVEVVASIARKNKALLLDSLDSEYNSSRRFFSAEVAAMNANVQTFTVTLQLPKDVYERVSQTASHEQRAFEDMLSTLVGEGLSVHASVRELFEGVSAQYRARLIREGKSGQSSDEVLQELRGLREQIANELYPG